MAYEVEVGNLSERVKGEVEIITKTGFNPWVYDTDGDCYISESEKNQAMADLDDGIITLSDALAVVNLWVMDTRNPACEVAGHLEFGGIYDYDTMKTYLTIPVTLPYGHDVFGAVLYYNDGATAVGMTCMVEFLNPDGVSVGKMTETESVGAGMHHTAATGRITLNKNGTWKIHTTLNGIDEKTWDAINVLAPEEEEEVGIWEWIKDHWEWIAGGAGVAAAIGVGVALVKRRK